MRRVYLNRLEPGMILAKTIFSPSGQVLLSEGVVLNEKYISRLNEFGVLYVFIKTPAAESTSLPETVGERTRIDCQTQVKKCFHELVKGDKICIYDISKQVSSILDELLTHPNVIFELSHIQTHSEQTFSHSVNVCILSLLAGITLGFNQNQLRDLGIGAILHDIGKTLLAQNILLKNKLPSGEKTNFEKHPVFGFDILRQYNELNLLAAHIAFQHHEHFDGQGYPRGLKGHEITEFARIVAYADLYDNLTTDYLDRKGCKPWEALKKLKESIGTKLDPELSDAFMNNIVLYPAGSIVEMKTGEMGIVLRNSRYNLTRPVVRLVVDSNKVPLKPFIEVDLKENRNYSIKKVYDDDDPSLPGIFRWNA